MNLNDEELQRAIEEGRSDDLHSADAKAYQILFEALSKRDENLSPLFADRVIQKAMANNQKKESSRDIWWLGVGIFFLSIGFVVAIAMVGIKFNLGFLKGVAEYSGLLLAGAVLITIFNILDKRLVGHRHNIQ
jgi:hypothetical protein